MRAKSSQSVAGSGGIGVCAACSAPPEWPLLHVGPQQRAYAVRAAITLWSQNEWRWLNSTQRSFDGDKV
ncbi:MAG: hypothetical protein R2911_26710 [Caldilineaceae bacterium]